MGNRIHVQDFSSIYAQGLKPFIEDFLKEKAESHESLVYSLSGKIVELNASDVFWIYNKLSKGPEQWEIKYLYDLSNQGRDVVYQLTDGQHLSVPAKAVIDLLDNIKQLQ